MKKIDVPSASSNAARNRMKAGKPKDTAPELELRSILQGLGLVFTTDEKPLPQLNRKADILFREAKLAVFVDGCFWHGCPIHGTQAKANSEFWFNKIETNKLRDRDTTQKLEEAGWHVVRIWEHEDPIIAVEKIMPFLQREK